MGDKTIQLVHGYLWDCWIYRNERLHGIDTDKERHRRDTQDRVVALYNDPARFYFQTREKKNLFRMKLEKRLQLSTSVLLTWIDIVNY